MSTYLLPEVELLALENDFKTFLIVHGIDSVEWKRIQNQDPTTQVYWVSMFSEYIISQVCKNDVYLQKKLIVGIHLFKLNDDDAIWIGILDESKLWGHIFENGDFLTLIKKHPANFRMFLLEKKYVDNSIYGSKIKEVKDLLAKGCTFISKEHFQIVYDFYIVNYDSHTMT